MTPSSHLDVWNQLHAAQIVAGDPPAVSNTPSPWYVRALLGIAGWIAASFAFGFVSVGFLFIIRSPAASVITGLAVIGGAYAIFKTVGKNDFAAQFGLAASFSGQALVMYGILSRSGTAPERWFLLAAIEAALAWLLPNFIHRVWSAYMAATALAVGLTASGGYFLSAGLLAAAAAVVWLNEFAWAQRSSLVRPVGYGLTLALVVVQGTFFARSMMNGFLRGMPADWVSSRVGAALPTVVLLVVTWQLLQRRREIVPLGSAMVAMFAALAIGAVSLKATGIATGLMIVVLGYANGSRTLLGLGIFVLLAYISAYYYLLDLTLLAKSEALAGVGAVLLAVRWVGARWVFSAEKVEGMANA
jgi:hypothetical protein